MTANDVRNLVHKKRRQLWLQGRVGVKLAIYMDVEIYEAIAHDTSLTLYRTAEIKEPALDGCPVYRVLSTEGHGVRVVEVES